MKFVAVFSIAALALGNVAFADSSDRKREKTLTMRTEVLRDLYRQKPSARDEIADAVGYGVFSNVGVNVVLFSAGAGSGIVRDARNGRETYMRMASAGVGIGLGVKDFRGVFVFHTEKALDNFLDHGWDFSGQADAAAKSGDKGGEENVSGTAINGVSLYQLTETGLALQATLQGTKYWKNAKLNR